MYFIRIARYRRGGMAEIFISYKSERRAAAAHLAKILERYGYTVWFDYHLVKGDDFADEIDRRIREAKAVVVLWCKLAVQSVWVRREAALADAARHPRAGQDRAVRTARGLRQRGLHRPFRLERRAARPQAVPAARRHRAPRGPAAAARFQRHARVRGGLAAVSARPR